MPKVVSERSISIPELKRVLEELESERDLDTVESTTLEYARKFAKVDPERVEEIVGELRELDLADEAIIQLINVMPSSIDEIRVILMHSPRVFTTGEIKRIKEILDRYREEQ